MQPHEQRVVEEETALAEKLNKLGGFIHDPVFQNAGSRHFWQEQDDHMRSYLNVLRKRIARFTGT